MFGFLKNLFNNSIMNSIQTFGNNSTIISGDGTSSCTINGKTYTGKSVSIINNVVYVDGKEVDTSYSGKPIIVNVVVEGNVESVSTSSGNVEIRGSVTNISTKSGDVSVQKNCIGDISTVSGDIQILGTVYGSCKSTSGDIMHN